MRLIVMVPFLPLVAALAVASSLATMIWHAWPSAHPWSPQRSTPRGSARRGVLYAFGPGLNPWVKEGSRRHPWVVIAGFTFHAGLFAAIAWLVLDATGLSPAGISHPAWTAVLSLGALGGVALGLRRVFSPRLRRVSVPDDFLANALSSLFVAAAAVAAASGEAATVVSVTAIALFVYAPLGKIRHCASFFVARARFGAEFGHRGVLPPPRGTRS